MGGRGPVVSSWVAGERGRVLRRELTEVADRAQADLAAWEQFKVSSPVKIGAKPKQMVDKRWVLTWREPGEAKTVEARFAESAHWKRSSSGLRESQIAPFTADIPGVPEKVADS